MAEQNVKKLAQIRVEEHAKFNNVIATSTKRSEEVEEQIAELFAGAFDDFDGCKIIPVGDPSRPESLKCKLYFKPCFNKTDEGVYAVKVRGEQNQEVKNGSWADIVTNHNKNARAKRFDLTELGKELLAEFVYTQDVKVIERYSEQLGKNVKFRVPTDKVWNNITEETADPVNQTRFHNPYFIVTLDLVPIVAKIYGKKDEAEVAELAGRGIPKDRYQYAINIVKVLNPTLQQYILETRRIDIKEINALAKSIGFGMVTSGINMTRRKY